jgi:hypothetical protein
VVHNLFGVESICLVCSFYKVGRSFEAAVVTCICLWCSMDNLCKDIFLRSKMDNNGFIPVSVIANFNRVSSFLS